MFFYICLLLLIVGSFLITRAQSKLRQQVFSLDLFVVALIVGLSDMLGGYDRYIYGEVFDSIADTIHSNRGLFNLNPNAFLWLNEPGYLLWNILIGIFTRNRYIYIFITTLTIYFLFYRSIKNSTSNPLFALILFLGLYFFFTFTYLRQVFAVAIVWNAMKFISKKRLGRFILIVSIATLFHNSAIISFIMYPLARKKFDFRIILLCFIFAMILGVAGINELIFKNFGHIVNNINRPDMNYEQIKSIRIEYILEASIFLVYIYSAYRNVKINKKDIVILNTAIMFCFVLVLFCRSSDGGRLSWFFLLGLIAFLTNQFGSGKNLTLKGLSLIAISSILFIRILIAWNGMIIPYKTFFSNGIREGDVIHAQFEYDRRYNDNKLYK